MPRSSELQGIGVAVFARSTSLVFDPINPVNSKAIFGSETYLTKDGQPWRQADTIRAITVDGVDVPVEPVTVMLADEPDRVYNVTDGQGGTIPVTKQFVAACLMQIFGEHFEEDQAARLDEIAGE